MATPRVLSLVLGGLSVGSDLKHRGNLLILRQGAESAACKQLIFMCFVCLINYSVFEKDKKCKLCS